MSRLLAAVVLAGVGVVACAPSRPAPSGPASLADMANKQLDIDLKIEAAESGGGLPQVAVDQQHRIGNRLVVDLDVLFDGALGALPQIFDAGLFVECCQQGRQLAGERVADAVARFGGSWSFILSFAVLLIAYTWINVMLRGRAWDPYPFILLNLFLSMLAAIQAPVIMMSQNRQDQKDRLRSELDFGVNRRAEAEIQGLARKLNLLGDKLGDVEDLLREKSARGELHG